MLKLKLIYVSKNGTLATLSLLRCPEMDLCHTKNHMGS